MVLLTLAGNWISMFMSEVLKPNLLQEEPYNLNEHSATKRIILPLLCT